MFFHGFFQKTIINSLTAGAGASLLFVTFFHVSVPSVFAQQATESPVSRYQELKQNISTRAEDVKKLEAEIAEYKQQLEVVGGEKKTLQNAVGTLDLTRAKLAKDAQLTQVKIAHANSAIAILSTGILEKEERIEANRALIANIIQKINETDSNSLIEILLGHESISSFLSEIDDLERMQVSIRDSIKSLERLKGDLSEAKFSHQEQKQELLGLNTQLVDQKAIADEKRKEQNLLLSSTKNKEANYKQLLADREARKKQFEREIEDFEAQLRVVIDPLSFPSPGTKVLAYPLENIFVTQKFGKSIDAARLYVSGTHNGIDFRASPGTPIKAAGDGVVIGTGDTDIACRWASYGRWVLIRHPNGLSTLYAHLDLIKVNEGQEVHISDLIGYSGNTGYSTGPHLHFTLFVSSAMQIEQFPSKSCPGAVFRIPVAPQNAYLDPEAYL